MIKNYRKKPVVIEAVRWDGTLLCLDDIAILASPLPLNEAMTLNPSDNTLAIKTLEGTMTANKGDWIIKGVAGELYPCKDSIFQGTYEEMTESPPNDLLFPREISKEDAEKITSSLKKGNKAMQEKNTTTPEALAAQEKMDGSPAHISKDFIDIRFQCGPIKEFGINGCQIEDVLKILIERLLGFQEGQFSCEGNRLALNNLESALEWLNQRTRDRIKRGVEGTNEQ